MARTASTSNKAALYNAIKKRHIHARNVAFKPLGIFYIERTIDLLTTDLQSGDELKLVEFPANCRLLNGSVTITDVDTHATPTLVFDINIDDDSTEQTLINDTDIGQGGGSASFSYGKLPGLDVSNQWLTMDVGTSAATAATGTITVRLVVATDLVSTW